MQMKTPAQPPIGNAKAIRSHSRIAPFPPAFTHQGTTMSDPILLDIDDPEVPPPIRAHAAMFQTKVSHVALEGNEFYLFDAKGELVDMGYLR